MMMTMMMMRIVMMMRTDKKSEMPRSSIVYSCRGREGATGSTTGRSNHRGALMKNKIVTMTLMGALIMLRMMFTIKAHNL